MICESKDKINKYIIFIATLDFNYRFFLGETEIPEGRYT